MKRELRRGLIFEIATDAGIVLKGKGDKRTCRCPFHEDRTASAFVSIDNVFFCAVCTPEGGWSAKRFCGELGRNWSQYTGHGDQDAPSRAPAAPRKSFGADEAEAVWRIAYTRARNDEAVELDREVYDYLEKRGLIPAYEYAVFGVLSEGMTLPEAIKWWPRAGYRIVSALHDARGSIAGVQSRCIRDREPKTLAPTGGRLSGTVFADERGLAVLRGESGDRGPVLLGEGLTDFLALSVASPVPVLCAPGTSNAASAIGEWIRGRDLWLALDRDKAGQDAVPNVCFQAYEHGCPRVRRVVWPKKHVDACDVVAEIGVEGLHVFLMRHGARRDAA